MYGYPILINGNLFKFLCPKNKNLDFEKLSFYEAWIQHYSWTLGLSPKIINYYYSDDVDKIDLFNNLID